jgi:hypothetical protein
MLRTSADLPLMMLNDISDFSTIEAGKLEIEATLSVYERTLKR